MVTVQQKFLVVVTSPVMTVNDRWLAVILTAGSMLKPTFNIHNSLGLKLLTRLRLGLSNLGEHRVNHIFENWINPLSSSSLEVESATHFFLHCHNFVNIRNALLIKLNSISCDISNCSGRSLTKVILYGNPKFSF